MIASILLFGVLALLVRSLCTTSKNNGGSIKCSTPYGRFIAHHFVEYLDDRVCSICGLVQKEGPAGILDDGDTWYDEGYAENKEEMEHFIQGKLDAWNHHWETQKQNQLKETREKRIATPIHKVATKEDETQ